MLQEHLQRFYTRRPEITEKLVKIVQTKTPFSLRLLDWFVTNYAKAHRTNYAVSLGNGSPTQFFVFTNYRNQLAGFSKAMFDPFCRRERLLFRYDNEQDGLKTTIGQLNFFKWAFENNVIDYLEMHKEEVERDMNEKMSSSSEEQDEYGRKKRVQLSKDGTKHLTKYDCSVTLSFD